LNCLQVIIGAVAIRTSNSGLEFKPSPLEQLGDACGLFQRAAETSRAALRKLVGIIVLVVHIQGQLTRYFRQPGLLRLHHKALRLHGLRTTRCDQAVGSTNLEGVVEDKWSLYMYQDLVQDVE
jgi:hypothetical protein